MPNKDIIVIRRSDSSGTTFIFTDYLSKISKDWEKNIGRSSSVNCYYLPYIWLFNRCNSSIP
ncbi:MAG: hypothetical protein AB1630_06060 [bacterium]